MEFPSITLGEPVPQDGALLARLQLHNKFVVPSPAEIAAAIDAARCGPAPTNCDSGDDDELVEPAPVPAPRRQRKRSLARVCEAARKAGADRVIVDGVVIALSPSAAVPESNTNEWDTVLQESDHGPH
jgi:hypothetical protein